MRNGALLLAGLIGITSCSGPVTKSTIATTVSIPTSAVSDGTIPITASSTSITATTTSTTTTVPGIPQSAPSSTPPAAANGVTALMWESAIDPSRVNATENRPTFAVGSLTGSVQSYIAIDTAVATGDYEATCKEAIATGIGGRAIGRCLLVQVTFDVAETGNDESASVVPLAYVGPDHIQVDVAFMDDALAFGGTVDNVAVFGFANVDPGGVLRLEISDGSQFETVKLDIPADLPPVNFG